MEKVGPSDEIILMQNTAAASSDKDNILKPDIRWSDHSKWRRQDHLMYYINAKHFSSVI